MIYQHMKLIHYSNEFVSGLLQVYIWLHPDSSQLEYATGSDEKVPITHTRTDHNRDDIQVVKSLHTQAHTQGAAKNRITQT